MISNTADGLTLEVALTSVFFSSPFSFFSPSSYTTRLLLLILYLLSLPLSFYLLFFFFFFFLLVLLVLLRSLSFLKQGE